MTVDSPQSNGCSPTLDYSARRSSCEESSDSSKLINIGSNRWGFKPEIGVTHVAGKWGLDAYLGGWFFTDNTNFFGGDTRSQDPILSTEAHARYFINGKWWASLDANFWHGGRTTVNGAEKDDLQQNSRLGLTLAWQVARQHGLRFAASRGAITRIGGDFASIGVSYSYNWRERPPRSRGSAARGVPLAGLSN